MPRLTPTCAALLTIGAVSPAIARNGCAAEIAQFRSVIDSDVATGNLAKRVHVRASADVDRAAAACAAGQDAAAIRLLEATKARYGYR